MFQSLELLDNGCEVRLPRFRDQAPQTHWALWGSCINLFSRTKANFIRNFPLRTQFQRSKGIRVDQEATAKTAPLLELIIKGFKPNFYRSREAL